MGTLARTLACVLLVVIWLPSFFLIRSLDTWQLIINTVTTIITFLMVALLQNSQTRTDQANEKASATHRDELSQAQSALLEQNTQLTKEIHEMAARLREVTEEVRAATCRPGSALA